MGRKKNLRTYALTHLRAQFIQRCLHLALQAYGQTSPNPMVGAAIVKNGKIIAEGYHKKAGQAHAEINALRKAGKRARGADLYVTLEPCCHFGKTPPCTDAVIKAGIRRIIYGMKDPNPKVSGHGLKILKSAGIKITGPVLENACIKLNQPFIKWITTGMPYVTAKIAVTLDGKIADAHGNSKWISNNQIIPLKPNIHVPRDYLVNLFCQSRQMKKYLPIILIFVMKIVNNKAIMGHYTSKPIANVIAWLTIVGIIVATVILVATSVLGYH